MARPIPELAPVTRTARWPSTACAATGRASGAIPGSKSIRAAETSVFRIGTGAPGSVKKSVPSYEGSQG